MENQEIIVTNLFKMNNDYNFKREIRIKEAILFNSGTIEAPKKHIISKFSKSSESFFLKPGKETLRKIPNEYDMSPNVIFNNNIITGNWTFEKIWEYLLKISIINQITFKKVLILIYRNCYFFDHQEKNNTIRYLPSNEIIDYIDKIEFGLKDGFMDKFSIKEIGLYEFLHFVDLLGWNEDVKYHIVDGRPNFQKYDKKVGRVNTILSIISAPLMISRFIIDVIEKTKNKGIIDVKLITSTIQKFSKSRGICVLSNKELLNYLEPYLVI